MMIKTKLILLLVSFIPGFIISGHIDNAWAGAGSGQGQSRSIRQINPPIIMPHVGPSRFLYYRWSPTDIIEELNNKGLNIVKTGPVTNEDYTSLPARANEDVRFSIPSIGEDANGCVLSFDIKDDMNKVVNHYRELNMKEELHSWTFVKDNVLIVLAGKIPEEKAKLIERTLNDMK